MPETEMRRSLKRTAKDLAHAIHAMRQWKPGLTEKESLILKDLELRFSAITVIRRLHRRLTNTPKS